MRPANRDRSLIARIAKGFDFLGYEVTSAGVEGVVQRTSDGFTDCVTQLYEQGATVSRIGDYVRRWLVWVRSGLPADVADGVFLFLSSPSLQSPLSLRTKKH